MDGALNSSHTLTYYPTM